MRVGINTLSATYGGGLTNATNLVKALVRLDDRNEYIVFLKTDKKNFYWVDKENVKYVECPIWDGALLKRLVWENKVLPGLLEKHRVDVFLNFGIYTILRRTCPQVFFLQVTLDYFSYKVWRYDPKVIIKKFVFGLTRKNIDSMLVLSDTVKNEVVHKYPEFEGRVFSVPIGTDHINSSVNTHNREFILTVSSFQPYKNYVNLIKAFGTLKKRYGRSYRLVIVGSPTDLRYYRRVKAAVRKMCLEVDVVFPGSLSFDELEDFFGRAVLYVFPSYLEADGATPLEAMASGVPVAASDILPVRDSCGDAAVYFNPFDAEEMAKVMYGVLDDGELRKKMIQKGAQRARQFTWEKAAAEVLKVSENLERSSRHY